jgi:CubicO group peptidase (beta-lactamase class C family)
MLHDHRVSTLSIGILALAVSAVGGEPMTDAKELPPLRRLPETLRAIRAKVQEHVGSGKIPSLVVGVLQDGEILWDEAFGWADRERKIRATADTLYPVASVSKSLTATGVFLLVQRGQVKLDDPVPTYLGPVRLPSIAPGRARPTVRQVLGMTGGIPHYVQYRWADEASPPPPTAALLQRHAYVAFPPGKHFHYSNLSYAVAEQVITQVSGTGFEAFMRRELFGPLGMARTFLNVPADLQDHVARPYDRGNHRARDFDFYPKGGAGFYSTAHDLLRFARFHLRQPPPVPGAILRPATIVALHRPDRPANGRPQYANGWGVVATGDAEPVLLSNGEFLGASATILLLPARRTAIVCLANVNASPRVSDAYALQIAGALAPGFTRKWALAEAAAEKSEHSGQPLRDLRGRWQGTLQTSERARALGLRVGADGKVSVRFKDDREVSLEKAHFDRVTLLGEFRGTWDAGDAGGTTPRIELELVRDGDTLQGVAALVHRSGLGLVEAAVCLRKQ